MPSCAECGVELQGQNYKRRVCFDCKQIRRRLAARNYAQITRSIAPKQQVVNNIMNAIKQKEELTSMPLYVKIIKAPKESVETLWQRLLRSVKGGDNT